MQGIQTARQVAWAAFWLLALSLNLTTHAQAQEARNWVFDCRVDSCQKNFAPVLYMFQSELNEAYLFIESLGFKGAALDTTLGSPWYETDKEILGPQFVLLSQDKFSAISAGAGAFYNPETKDITFPVGRELEAQTQQIPTDGLDDPGAFRELLKNAAYDETHRYYLFAHELFHAFQNSHPAVNFSEPYLWVIEGTAVAIGEEWRAKRFGTSKRREMKFDEPLHIIKNPEFYERGFFFEQLSNEIGDSPKLSYLVGLFKKGPGSSTLGLDWLADHIKSNNGVDLHKVYNEIVRKHTNTKQRFNKVAKEIIVKERDTGPQSASGKVGAVSTMAREITLSARALSKPKNPEEGVAYLALVTMEIPGDGAPAHAEFIVEDEWLKVEKRKYAVFDLVGKDVTFLSRVTNMQKSDIDNTKDEEISVQAQVDTIEIRLPTCIAPGATVEIEVPELPEEVSLELEAQKGSISDAYLYTAPAEAGSDKLRVKAFVSNSDEKFVDFAELKIVSKGCPFKVTSSDNHSFTYDPKTETTLVRDQSNSAVAMFEREFIYANDPSMGGWIKMPRSVMDRMAGQGFGNAGGSFGGIFNFDFKLETASEGTVNGAMITPGKHAFDWGRAPFDFLIIFEYGNLSKFVSTKAGGFSKSRGVGCPASAPKCTVISTPNADQIIYNRMRQIVLIRLHDGMTLKVERVDTSVSAPKGARTIKF